MPLTPKRERAPPSGFEGNGFEHMALDVERLGRCASLCLDPYPQPSLVPSKSGERLVKKAGSEVVPPCTYGLPSALEQKLTSALPHVRRWVIAEGPLALHNGTEKRVGMPQKRLPPMLPPTFLAPQFRHLLFRYDPTLEACAALLYGGADGRGHSNASAADALAALSAKFKQECAIFTPCRDCPQLPREAV